MQQLYEITVSIEDKDVLQEFLEASRDQLEEADELLLTIETMGEGMSNAIQTLFRSIHTVKGTSGFFGLTSIEMLAHRLENVLDLLRSNQIDASSELIDALLAGIDKLRALLAAVTKAVMTHQPPDEQGNIILAIEIVEIEANLEWLNKEIAQAEQGVVTPVPQEQEESFSFSDSFLDFFTQTLASCNQLLSALDKEEEKETSLVGLEENLTEIRGQAAAIDADTLAREADEALDLVVFLKKDPSVENITLLAGELRKSIQGLQRFIPSQETTPKKECSPEPSTVAVLDPKADMQLAVKVPQERLDHLLNMVGELVISGSGLEHFSHTIALEDGRPDIAGKVKKFSSAVTRIGDEIQESIMKVRMVPVGNVFGRFPRLVRDLSRRLGKKIVLKLDGAETKLDKTSVEAINDPLLHIIRNSADHGFESPDERIKAGKLEECVITIEAESDGHSVYIYITDDGRGIDVANVKQKALSSNLVTQETLTRMSEQAILNLIFEPGFSTAKEVSSVSGRGVGMDVVRKGIAHVGGTVKLSSQKGVGTKVVMKLPLTMAVNRGLEIAAGSEHYYLPMEFVVETVKAPLSVLHRHKRQYFINIRDQTMPMLDVGAILQLSTTISKKKCGDDLLSLVVLDLEGRKVAFLVDRFFRDGEYVLKSMPTAMENIEGIRGSVITPTGKIILVLDPVQMLSLEAASSFVDGVFEEVPEG